MHKRKRGTTRDMMVQPVVVVATLTTISSELPLVDPPRCVVSPPCGHCWYCWQWDGALSPSIDPSSPATGTSKRGQPPRGQLGSPPSTRNSPPVLAAVPRVGLSRGSNPGGVSK